MTKKKIIIISIISIILIVAIIGVIVFLVDKNSSEDNTTYTSKIDKLYNTLNKKGSFSFTTIVDDNNKEIYITNGNSTYIDTTYNGEESKYVIKDGNSYLLKDEDKIYYTYKNNQMELNKVLEQLEEIKESQLTQGKEKIEGKEYEYEEYSSFTNFALKLPDDEYSENIKTRFYFDGDNLVYIKTIIGNEQETLKVEISNKINESLFEIPSDYREI